MASLKLRVEPAGGNPTSGGLPGSWCPRTRKSRLTERGYRIAPVTVDNEDYVFAAAYSRAAARGDQELMERVVAAYVAHTKRVLEYSKRLSLTLFDRETKQVVLLHANALNAEHFLDLAAMMERRGYSFVALDDDLRDEAPDSCVGGESLDWLARWAITEGIRTNENVLDDVPDVPQFVKEAAVESGVARGVRDAPNSTEGGERR